MKIGGSPLLLNSYSAAASTNAFLFVAQKLEVVFLPTSGQH